MIQITRHHITVPGLPGAMEGIKVAQLSDFHRSHLTKDSLLHHAVQITLNEKPDIILLTGDYVTFNQGDIEPCGHIIQPLKAPLGVYAVLGNHDYSTDAPAVERMLKHNGVHVLVNQGIRLPQGLCIIGLEDDR